MQRLKHLCWKNAPGIRSFFSKFAGFGLGKADSMISAIPVNLPIVSEQLFYIAPPPGECFRVETCSSLNFRAICFLEWWWMATFVDRMCVFVYLCVYVCARLYVRVCVVYVYSPWSLCLSGVGIPGDRSTMLCWRRFFLLPSPFIATLVWSTEPLQLATLSCSAKLWRN